MVISGGSHASLERCSLSTYIPIGVTGSAISYFSPNATAGASFLPPAIRGAIDASIGNANNSNISNNNNSYPANFTVNETNLDTLYDQILHRDLFIEFVDKYISATRTEIVLPFVESQSHQCVIATDRASLTCEASEFASRTLDEIVQDEVELGMRVPAIAMTSPIMSVLFNGSKVAVSKLPGDGSTGAEKVVSNPNLLISGAAAAPIIIPDNTKLEEMVLRLYSVFYTVRRCWSEYILHERALYLAKTQDQVINLVEKLNGTVGRALAEQTRSVLGKTSSDPLGSSKHSSTGTYPDVGAQEYDCFSIGKEITPVDLWPCERWYNTMRRELDGQPARPKTMSTSGSMVESNNSVTTNNSSNNGAGSPGKGPGDLKMHTLENVNYFSVVAGAHPALLRGNYSIVARDSAKLNLKCNIFYLRSRQPPKKAQLASRKSHEEVVMTDGSILTDPIQLRKR
ncbi:hypothetical protein ADEAN_000986600 [Angomonas deanei]|uniref:Uncharacterized protein n=1 Tax=Angomonas deanei TaxID=59799 RepID=A0A7G2CVI6_9TRYP|nr:hypothetical protein ADEAN_000986600 [Angomonas deanei]